MNNFPMLPKKRALAITLSLAAHISIFPSFSLAQDIAPQAVTASATQEASADLLSLFREAAQNDPTYNAAKAAMLAGGER